MALKVGEKISEFSVRDQNGKEIKLSSLRGKKVLLSFHPLAWTSVCSAQMKSLEDHLPDFQKLEVVPLGISVDAPPTKQAWAKTLGIANLSLVSDFWPHGGLAKELGLFRDKEGISERANVLLDEQGRVLWFKIYPFSEVPDVKEILEVLSAKKKAA